MIKILTLALALFLTACSSPMTLEKQKQDFINSNGAQQRNWLMSVVDTHTKKVTDDAKNRLVKYERYLRTGKHDVEKRVPSTSLSYSCIDPRTNRRSTRSSPFGTDCVTVQNNFTVTRTVQENMNQQEIQNYEELVSSTRFILKAEKAMTDLVKEYLLSVHEKQSPSAAFDEAVLFSRGVLQNWSPIMQKHCRTNQTEVCMEAARVIGN